MGGSLSTLQSSPLHYIQSQKVPPRALFYFTGISEWMAWLRRHTLAQCRGPPHPNPISYSDAMQRYLPTKYGTQNPLFPGTGGTLTGRE